MSSGPVVSMVAAAAVGVARFLKKTREIMALDREYTAVEVADLVSRALDGRVDDALSSKITTETDGENVIVTLHHHDGVFDRTAPTGQVFTVTVALGASGRTEPDETGGERLPDGVVVELSDGPVYR